MRATVIISVRNELEVNLLRTVESLRSTITPEDSILIVADGYQRLPEMPPHEVPVVIARPWDKARGCGQARHWGIERAESDIVVLTDGHMSFPAGWLDAVVTHLDANPLDITCAHMQSITHDWKDIPGQIYSGACLRSMCAEPQNECWPIAAKWATTDIGEGRIGACMGACYGLRRSHYLSAMGGCLQILEAWGGDEEILSMACWLAGGTVWLMPQVARHMYAAPSTRQGMTPFEAVEIWANRLAVLHALPMSDASRKPYIDWLTQGPQPWPSIWKAMERRRDRIDSVRAALAKHKRKWGVLKMQIRPMSEEENIANLRKRASLAVDDSARRKANAAPVVTVPPIVGATKADAPVTPAVTLGGKVSTPTAPPACPRCGYVGTLSVIPYGPSAGWLRCSRCGHLSRP